MLGVCVFTNGCGNGITVPESDATPPDIEMGVYGFEEPIALTPSSASVTRTVDPGQTISFLATATDKDGGVKSVAIHGTTLRHCVGDQYSQMMHGTLVSQNPDDAQVGETAQTARTTFMKLEIPKEENMCNEGYSFRSYHGTFYATGENFHDGTMSTATITLKCAATPRED
jgi:hypothetical protein